jgi:hypothetical protein
MLFGTYDLSFDGLGFDPGTYVGVPAVVARIRGDSIDLTLAPDSKLPITLVGVRHADSVVGRWRAYRGVGPGVGGDFVLQRE